MSLPQISYRITNFYCIAARNIVEPAGKGRCRLGLLQAILKALPRFGIVHHQLGATVDSEHQGPPSSMHVLDGSGGLTLEVGQRQDVVQVQHGWLSRIEFNA